MSGLIVILCLAAVPLMMWGMIVQRRRVRERLRSEKEPSDTHGENASYVEEVRGPDGLSYGRRHDTADELMPPDTCAGEVGGVRAMQGRR